MQKRLAVATALLSYTTTVLAVIAGQLLLMVVSSVTSVLAVLTCGAIVSAQRALVGRVSAGLLEVSRAARAEPPPAKSPAH